MSRRSRSEQQVELQLYSDADSGLISPPSSPTVPVTHAKNGTLEPTSFADRTGNPAPLGLCAFGMTTMLLNLHNAGLFKLDAMIIGMGLFYGGLAQVIAGIMEWCKGNTFATTAFISYGFFWMSLVIVVVAPETGGVTKPSKASVASWFIVWGMFTAILTYGTLKLSCALRVVFSLLTLLFALLAIAELSGLKALWVIAGIEGIACGASAVYAGLAQVINQLHGTVVMPIDTAHKSPTPRYASSRDAVHASLAQPHLGGRAQTAP